LVSVDAAARDIDVDDLDALLLVGGDVSDTFDPLETASALVADVVDAGKLVAAVCHGARLLAKAGVASSLELTSWPELQQELVQAGALWRDQAVVEDGMFITSRRPDDLDDFSRALLARLSDEVRSAPGSLHF
jgi:protease I